MAAFAGAGATTVLIRNHEVDGPVGAFGPVAQAYDPAAGGGTTTVVVDRDRGILSSRVSLNGTVMNCSGGPMPWGSWISCEETVAGPDLLAGAAGAAGLQEKHGYIFEVPLVGEAPRDPIRSAGRFPHEAAAYERSSDAVYLTEDNFDFPSGFYRYLPPAPPWRTGTLLDGGRLQMLGVEGRPSADLAGVDEEPPLVGERFPVVWVDVDEPDPDLTGASYDEALVAVGGQGREKGAAVFARLEGAVAHEGTVYFCSTQGGGQPPDAVDPPGFGSGRGQIWAYTARTETLHLLYESPSTAVLDFPDNITTGRGGSLVICEDGVERNYVRGLTPGGQIFDFARNEIEGRVADEFAGPTFAPDLRTLFVNIQSLQGMTFAIWGPWERGPF